MQLLIQKLFAHLEGPSFLPNYLSMKHTLTVATIVLAANS